MAVSPFSRLVPLLTFKETTRLCWLRAINLAARQLVSRSGRKLSRRHRCRRWLAGCVSYDARADLRVGLEPTTRLAADLEVPCQNLLL